MHLRTRVWQVKNVPAETPVSYGHTFVTKRRTRIAVLPIGYADGYARALSNIGQVLVCGRRAPVLGRVCMDLTMVDVTDIPGVQPGEEVVLWGRQREAELSVNEVADWQGSISYELLTRVGKRVPRLAMGSSSFVTDSRSRSAG
jgi:alanine racemase